MSIVLEIYIVNIRKSIILDFYIVQMKGNEN